MSPAARLLPALAAAALAALAATSPAHADPPLPSGWIAGGPAATMIPPAPPGARSRLALQLTQRPQRAALTPVPVALEDLDVAEIAPELTEAEVAASNADPPGDPAEELFVDHGCTRASVSGHAVGSITVGWLSEHIAPRSGGGVELFGVRGEHGGGDGRHLYARASWETLDVLPGGALRFTETVARFNVVTCKARVASRYTAIARPILGGRAFLFRTRCPACSPELRDRLHVIAASESFRMDEYEHHGVALAPGHASGLVVQAEPPQAARFAHAVGRPAPALRARMDSFVGIEAAQTLGEASPTVIAYTADVLERVF